VRPPGALDGRARPPGALDGGARPPGAPGDGANRPGDSPALSATNWAAACRPLRDYFWEEVIGRFPPASLPAHPRARKLYDKPGWTGYEVMLDVYPDVFAWGYLLAPKDLQPGERRPVVVCQHGLEGLPEDVVSQDPQRPGFGAYRGYAARLADRGFIVYAPHNPYRGGDKFRVLQRKANPLKKSLFSIILAQHERTLEWLAGLPFADPARIGFYGLSYGGKTAMRVPALLDGYCLSICSADFNEWIKKNVTTESSYSYMFTGEYEMPEFNLGNTFNYAEMAALIAPRPFMVERGHRDGVAPDEWVAYEYSRVRRCYERLGLGEKTEIEFFDGPHTINGVGTFKFLHRHLIFEGKD
jgi:cephalosporin-C deacetylase-like acetyl esterase